MNLKKLKQEVESIKWFHSIDLGNGIVTPGFKPMKDELKQLQMPADLTGKKVLDIGAWDGFYSFEAEKRGASLVVALDYPVWSGLTWVESKKKSFDLARKVLDSKVEDVTMDVYDMSPENLGTFDLVLFMGVIYHLKHPLLALEKVASVCRDMLILESYVDVLRSQKPVMVFYPEDECHGDPSNWFGINPVCMEAMLKTVGFERNEKISIIMQRLIMHSWKYDYSFV